MIKRPLVLVLAAFVIGCFLSSISWLLFALIICMLYIWIGVCFLQGWIHVLDRFLVILPLAIFLGYLLMNHQLQCAPLDHLFEDNIMGKMQGEIYEIIQTDTNTKIYLKDLVVKLQDDTNAVDQVGTNEKVFYCSKVLVYASVEASLKVGNKISVYGQINKFQRSTNLGQFDEYQFYKIQNIDYKVYAKSVQVTNDSYSKLHAILNQIKEKLVQVYSSILNEKESGIVSAMLLGETNLLDRDMKELYQKNGIAHILAISGLHITLIGMCFFKIFQKLRIHISLSIFFTIILIFLYGILTNFSVSTNRAVVMLIIGLLAKIIGKTYDLITAMSLSALVILIQAPLQLYNCGFLLSFGAIMGIAIVLPAINRLRLSYDKDNKDHSSEDSSNDDEKIENNQKRTAWDGKEHPILTYYKEAFESSILVSLSVTIMTLPLLLYFFFQIPLYSIVLNLIVIPLMTLVVMLSLVGGILGCFSLFLARICIGGVHFILVLYEGLCRFFESLPYSNILVGKPSLFLILCYYMILVVFVMVSIYHQKKKYLFVLFLLFLIFYHPRESELEISFLDVGQGDGIFFETPSNTTYLLDGGSSDVKQVGKFRLLPFLKAKGISHIDYAIMTHADSDHISGLLELMEEIEIGTLLVPDTSLVTPEYSNLILLAENKNIKVVRIQKGDVLTDGEVTLTCLHPYYEFIPDNNNEYSTVICMEYGEFQALLTGDLGAEGEKMILKELKDCDLLKVAHHGSKNSTSMDFLEKVDPEYGIISCGKNNRYGHPHDELIERLSKCNTKIYITSESGAITVKVKDGKMVMYENNP